MAQLNIVLTARQLNIARKTARNIVMRFQQSGEIHLRARGGAHVEEMVTYLIRKVETKLTITLMKLRML